MQDISAFMIEDVLTYSLNPYGLQKLHINTALAKAEIYLHGANMTHFQARSEKPLLFDAQNIEMDPNKTLHAGAPICWPWFGPHPSDKTKPQHGFARTSLWQLKSTQHIHDTVRIVLTLSQNEETLVLFEHDFNLEITFTIAKQLSISLTTTNTSSKPFSFTDAIHTYFNIGNINDIQIKGLEHTPFIDATDNKKEKIESESLEITQEVNRVYIPTTKTCEIIDKSLSRSILVSKEGSNATTLWNPWRENGIHDLGGEKYQSFVCIESVNALDDLITLQPTDSHTIAQIIELSKH